MVNRSVRTWGSALGAMGLAFASVTIAPATAHADNTWACEVVLCLSNPGGPTQYDACVPPIEQLWSSLLHGGGFPTCSGSNMAFGAYGQAFGNTLFQMNSPGQPTAYYVIRADANGQMHISPLTADQANALELQAEAQLQAQLRKGQ